MAAALCGVLSVPRAAVSLRLSHYSGFVVPGAFTTLVAPAHLLHATPEAQQAPMEPHQSRFMNQVESTVKRVLNKHKRFDKHNILELPPAEREAVGVARNLDKRLSALARNGDCRRCWLQRTHCVCDKCPPLEGHGMRLPKVRRLFLLMHHKEVCLAVDTARMILASFPETCRLVVGGIGPEYQESMVEMMDAIKETEPGRERKCLVLFPTDDATSYAELEAANCVRGKEKTVTTEDGDEGWDVIVIDGTWAQARKLHARYIYSESEGGPPRVKLSDGAVGLLSRDLSSNVPGASLTEASETRAPGHQLRRHPTVWRAVSTLEATRLLLGDMMAGTAGTPEESSPSGSAWFWDTLSHYQEIADAATRRQLGPHR